MSATLCSFALLLSRHAIPVFYMATQHYNLEVGTKTSTIFSGGELLAWNAVDDGGGLEEQSFDPKEGKLPFMGSLQCLNLPGRSHAQEESGGHGKTWNRLIREVGYMLRLAIQREDVDRMNKVRAAKARI